MPIFSREEITRRCEAVRAALGHAECAVVPSFHNSYYVSGVPILPWGRPAVSVLFQEHDPLLIVPAFESVAALENSPIVDVAVYRDEDGPNLSRAASLVAEALKKREIKRVGIEANGMPAAMYMQLVEALPKAQFSDVTEAVDRTRLVSSEEELAYLREAAHVADVGMFTVLDLMAPGVEEHHLAVEARLAMEAEMPPGVQGRTACYMQQGVRSTLAHAEAMRIPVQEGQILEVVCECEVWHYQTAVERCVLVGKCPPETERAYEAMLEAFLSARDAVRPASTFADVDTAARRVFADAGYDDFWMSVGHVRNIIGPHGGRIDQGNCRTYNQTALQPGMFLTVEPWAVVPEVGAPRHCDSVLVTEDGQEIWTRVDSGRMSIPSGG